MNSARSDALRPSWLGTVGVLTRWAVLMVALGQPSTARVLIPVAPGATDVVEDGVCSLPEAIDNANADALIHDDCLAGSGPDRIQLGIDSNYVFSKREPSGQRLALPTILDDLTIRGRGSLLIRSSTSGTPTFGFIAAGAVELEIFNLGFFNGEKDGTSGGGAISLVGTDFSCTDCDFAQNRFTGSFGYGGALSATSSAEVDLLRSRFFQNKNFQADSMFGAGGAVGLVDSSAVIRQCAFVENSADEYPAPAGTLEGTTGGAIFAEVLDSGPALFEREIYVENTTFSANHAFAGGAIALRAVSGTTSSMLLTLAFVTMVENTASPGIAGISLEQAPTNPSALAVVFYDSILHSQGSPPAYPGRSCGSGSGSFISLGGNLLDPPPLGQAPDCPVDVLDIEVESLDGHLDLDLALDHYQPDPGGLVIGNAVVACGTVPVDQLGEARPANCDIGAIQLVMLFADGFESGDTSRWQ